MYLFAAMIGFSCSLAEPSLIAVVENGEVIGIVSLTDMVLRGLCTMWE